SGSLTLNTTGDSTSSGVISGSGSLTKAGASTLTLTGANTYTGTTTANAGLLQIQNPGSGNWRSSTAIASGATVEFDTGSTNYTVPANWTLSGTGVFKKLGSGNMLLGSSAKVTMNQSAGGWVDIQAGKLQTGSHQNSWTTNQGSLNVASSATMDIVA